MERRTRLPLSEITTCSQSQTGFRRLVEQHQARVFSIAFRMLMDRGAAEEVAQDVFLSLYGSLEQIESEEHLLAWLRRVTVHRATDALRRRATRPEFAAEEFLDEGTMVPVNGMHRQGTHSQGTQSQARMVHDSTNIERLVATLPPAQRSVVLLRYQEDMLPGEIAATLAMPLATVKSHLQRALKLLRTKLKRQAERPLEATRKATVQGGQQ